MNHTKISKILVTLFAVVFCFGPVGLAEPVGTAFTYQGRLFHNNYWADGLYDLKFRLYDSPSGPNQIGGEVLIPNKQINDGYFTVELDFGDVFDGNDRCLEIDVRRVNDPNGYTTLSPRQKVTPTPYALYTLGVKDAAIPQRVIVMWSGSVGSIPSGWALCNGSNGTPDLRNRFIVGAGSSYGVGSTGGEATHTLTTAEMPAHTHNSIYNAWGPGERGDTEDTAYWNVTYPATSSTGGNQPHENRPPYYALAYIMKL